MNKENYAIFKPGEKLSDSKPKCIICDIDGTVALMKGKRTPFEYHKAHKDVPNKPVIDVLRATTLYYRGKYDEVVHIIFTSARENVTFDNSEYENAFELTLDWINTHIGESKFNRLILRQEGDWRKDSYVKFEIGKEIMEEYDVLCVFDDRNQVVDMWRNGLQVQCFQVADGNF